MNEVEMLALGDALARTSEVLRPGECLAFRNYLERVLRSEAQVAAVFGGDTGLPGASRPRLPPLLQSGRWTSRSGS